MKISVGFSSGDALSLRAVRRASRTLFLAACVVTAVCATGAVLLFRDAWTVVERNAFLAEKTAGLEAEARGTAADADWKALRERGAFFASGLRAGGPGVVELLALMEGALPEGVVFRQVQVSRGGSLVAEGASKTLDGGDRFRKRLEGAGPRWSLSVENLGYDQTRREYPFRLKGAWRSR